jgi:hypothetical protein
MKHDGIIGSAVDVERDRAEGTAIERERTRGEQGQRLAEQARAGKR